MRVAPGFMVIMRAAEKGERFVENLSPQTRAILAVMIEDFALDPVTDGANLLTEEMLRCAVNSCRMRGLIE